MWSWQQSLSMLSVKYHFGNHERQSIHWVMSRFTMTVEVRQSVAQPGSPKISFMNLERSISFSNAVLCWSCQKYRMSFQKYGTHWLCQKFMCQKINIAGGAELPKNLETKLCPNESQMPYHIVLQDLLFVQLDFLLALSKFSSLSLSLSFEWANRLLLK